LLFRSKTRFPPFGGNNQPHVKQQYDHHGYNRNGKVLVYYLPHEKNIPVYSGEVKSFFNLFTAVAINFVYNIN
jgi:hypothetical protein